MNRWGTPADVEAAARKRDKNCVYCGVVFKRYAPGIGGRTRMATLEHINNNDVKSPSNVVMCCGSCNSSKGTKTLAEWLESEYCKKNKINEKRVALVVRNWIKRRSR